jgi:cysteine-rich repeat protein
MWESFNRIDTVTRGRCDDGNKKDMDGCSSTCKVCVHAFNGWMLVPCNRCCEYCPVRHCLCLSLPTS